MKEPKEYAIELMNKFKSFDVSVFYYDEYGDTNIATNKLLDKSAIDCALICIEEIIQLKFLENIPCIDEKEYIEYFNEVKKELINLKNK